MSKSKERKWKKGGTAYVEGVNTPFLIVEDKFDGYVYAVHGPKNVGQPQVKIDCSRLMDQPTNIPTSKPSLSGREEKGEKKTKPRARKQTGYKEKPPREENQAEGKEPKGDHPSE